MPWIGVDFDGTLATDEGSHPIPAMVERVKRWLAAGIEVRILTARVARNQDTMERFAHKAYVENWCFREFGQILPVTCEKDFSMYQLWDDRAVQVVKDTGERIGNLNRPSNKAIGKTLVDEETGFFRE